MPRYFTRKQPTAWVETFGEDFWPGAATVPAGPCVPDHEATDTGLLDHRGDPIMRAPNPMGFGRMEEW